MNTISFTTFKAFTSTPTVQNFSNMEIDIDTDIIGERSTSSSKCSSRESSTHLNALSVLYYKRMEIQNNNLSWSKQIDTEDRERFSLSYPIPKEGKEKTVKQAIDSSLKIRV